MSAMAPAPAYAFLADGSTVLVRPAGPADFEAVKAMHEATGWTSGAGVLAADACTDQGMIVQQPQAAATGDLTAAITQARVSVPIAAVVLGQRESVRLLDGADGKRIPAYDCPEAAAGAMARAVP